MPVPIRPIFDGSRGEAQNSSMDYSFLANQLERPTVTSKRKVMASNKDAALLFEIWLNATKDNEKFNVSEFNSRDVMRLKNKGLVAGNSTEIEFTRIGKMVITTMALGEGNEFESKKQEKSYHDILASMDKRGKPGYRTPTYASHNNNNLRLDNG